MRQARCGRQALTAAAWLGPSFQPTENITFQMESQVAKQEEEFRQPKYIFHGFMERLWAYLTIHQLLERMWVACTPKGLLGRPHMASMSSQGHHGWDSTGGLRISCVWREGIMVWCLSSRLSQ